MAQPLAKILVVDDVPTNLRILFNVFASVSYQAHLLQDSRQALSTALELAPDLILLDIQMPHLDGFQVCAQLKAEPRTRDIPVIFISAHGDVQSKLNAFAAGGADYVEKPFNPNEVLARVATHLRLQTLQQGQRATNADLRVVLSQHQAILNAAGEGILGLDREGRVTFANPKALHQLGYAEEELLGTDFHARVHPPNPGGRTHETAECPILRALAEGICQLATEDDFIRKDGRVFPVEYSVSVTHDQHEQTRGIVLFRDISHRRRLEQELKQAAAVFEVSSEGIVLTSPAAIIQRVNPAFSKITGYDATEVVGQNPRILKSGHHPPEFYQTLWQQLHAEGYWEGEIWNRRKDGSVYPEWEMITAIRDHHGNVTGYVSQFSEITRRKLTEEEIRYRGNYDALTGLPNRTLLLERLEYALTRHRKEQHELALLFIDLDGFKQVNDTFGHAFGDQVLQQAAARIRAEIRDTDTAARLGGDEFVVMLAHLRSQAPIRRTAARVLETLAEPFVLNEREIQMSASIGIALFPGDGNDIETLFRNADLAMYRAKANGSQQVQFFTEALEREFLTRNRLEADLRQALARGELAVHYQPILELHNGKLAGVEALLRWHHPELGSVPPSQFIPIAEETGLINAIGEWVLETVCHQLSQWHDQGWTLYASVNVSPRQVPQDLPPKWLQRLIRKAHIPPASLVLEITESIFIKELTVVGDWLQQVRALGIRVYLDDFGTGYSSLSYLKNFPVDALKIDQIFVREMAGQARDQALVRAIVAMSEGLGLQVVAEGIETQEQNAILCSLNCPYGQGYLFSKPVAVNELEHWQAARAQ